MYFIFDTTANIFVLLFGFCRIQRLVQLHRRAYVILVAALMGPEQTQSITALQNRLVSKNRAESVRRNLI